MATVRLTVSSLTGQEVWAGALLASEPVRALRLAVAEKLQAGVDEVLLLLGEVELKSEVTLADAGIDDGAELGVVRLDPAEAVRRALDQLLSSAVHNTVGANVFHGMFLGEFDELTSCDDREQLSQDGYIAWLSEIADACGCEETGFQGEVKEMLEVIGKSGKAFGQRSAWVSASLLRSQKHGPGQLCLESKNSQYGFRATFVDLTGALAQIFGAPADRYKGVVWTVFCDEDDYSDILHKFGFGSGPGSMQWKAFADHIRDINRLGLLPHPAAPNVTTFFRRWASDGCPAFIGEVSSTFGIPEVTELHESTARIQKEREEEEEMAKKRSFLLQIFSFLDREGRDEAVLLPSALRPLWEVGGWVAADADSGHIERTFADLCQEKGFDTSGGISEAALCACLPRMPPSPDIEEFYCRPDDAATFQDYVTVLRAGPHRNGHYLGPLQRAALVTDAAIHELFTLLDTDRDRRLRGSEFRPFIELMHVYHPGGWDPPPATPWHANFIEEEATEVWRTRFVELCEARGTTADLGFSQALFAEYVKEANIYHAELAWAADCIRMPPPGGHHISWLDFIGTTSQIHSCGCKNAQEVAEIYQWDGRLFGDAYEQALQGLGLPRSLTVLFEGAECSVTVVPSRQYLPDDWKLIECTPKAYEWTLVSNS